MFSVLFSLALRNLWRQKKRTFLTLIALAFGVFSLIAMDSLLTGIDRMSTLNLVDFELGHLQVQPAEYYDAENELTLDHAFSLGTALSELQQEPLVGAAAPRLRFQATLNTGWEEYTVVGVGVDPTKDPEVFRYADYIQGQWVQPASDQIVIGQRIAELLEVERGDFVTVVTRTKAGSFQAIDMEVTGILATPHPLVNRTMVFLPLDVVQSALGMSGEVTNVAIRLAEERLVEGQERVQAIADRTIQAPEISVYTWRQLAESFLAISQSKRMGNLVLLMMIVIIAVVGVVNTILLGAIERTREIGMLKAMGMRNREVVYEFMLEAVGIGFFGSILGVILGSLLNLYFVNVGIDFTSLLGDIDMGYPVLGAVHGVWNPGLMLLAVAFGVVVSVLASLVPAVYAARRDPIWALRQ